MTNLSNRHFLLSNEPWFQTDITEENQPVCFDHGFNRFNDSIHIIISAAQYVNIEQIKAH